MNAAPNPSPGRPFCGAGRHDPPAPAEPDGRPRGLRLPFCRDSRPEPAQRSRATWPTCARPASSPRAARASGCTTASAARRCRGRLHSRRRAGRAGQRPADERGPRPDSTAPAWARLKCPARSRSFPRRPKALAGNCAATQIREQHSKAVLFGKSFKTSFC
jgi:hypothetical protein